MGMTLPEEYGGAGTDTLSYAIAIEELTRIDSSVAAPSRRITHSARCRSTSSAARRSDAPGFPTLQAAGSSRRSG